MKEPNHKQRAREEVGAPTPQKTPPEFITIHFLFSEDAQFHSEFQKVFIDQKVEVGIIFPNFTAVYSFEYLDSFTITSFLGVLRVHGSGAR